MLTARSGLWSILLLAFCCLVLPAREPGPPDDSDRAAIALEALSRLKGLDLETNAAVKAAVLRVLEQVRGTPRFVEIVRDFNIKGQEPALLAIAIINATNSTGAEAMRLLLDGRQFELLKKSLQESNALAVAECMGNAGRDEIVELLEPILVDGARDLALRKQTVRSVVRVRKGAEVLLRLAREQRLPSDLKLTAASELSQVRWENIKSEAAQVLALPSARNGETLPPISELIRSRGDSAKGAEIFRRETVACIKCHQVNGEGTDFGPNLSEIGTKLGKDALYEAILDPSAGIAFGYESWEFELTNGEEVFGMIASETTDEVAIKTVGGIVTRYRKNEIAGRVRQKLSIMPADLQKALSTQDLADLIEYLSSLKKDTRQ